MKIYCYTGWLLIAIGCIHNAFGLIVGWPILLDMVNDGVWNTVQPSGAVLFDRSAIVWFLLTGCFWWLLGGLMQHLLYQELALPRWLGFGFVLLGLLAGIVLPASGAWLFIPLGLLLCLPPRDSTYHHAV
ncbi:MAG TPA: DUF6463 family protein [Marinagarivorans sp.]